MAEAFTPTHNPEAESEALVTAPQNVEDMLKEAQQKTSARMSQDRGEAFQTLGQEELAELNAVIEANPGDSQRALQAHQELHRDLDALTVIAEQFAGLGEHYDEFVNFLTSGDLSPQELESFYDVVESEKRMVKRDFRTQGYPKNRTEFTIFADKFGIETSTEMQEDEDEVSKISFLSALSIYRSIEGISEVDTLTSMIANLEDLEGAQARAQMDAINTYLIGEDGQGWEIDNILQALREKDQLNAQQGRPTQYLQTFVRTTRDFSPQVASRIDIFLATQAGEAPVDGEPTNPLLRGIVEGWIPEGSSLDMRWAGEFVATTPQGDTVTITIDGDHITRNYSLEGSDFSLGTEIQRGDFSSAVGEYETVGQELSPKLDHTQNALLFLENPEFVDTPLEEMKVTLLQILWHSLFNELGVREATDKTALITVLKNNVWFYKTELGQAKEKLDKAVKEAVARNQESNARADEAIKATLRRIQILGFDLWDIDFILAQVTGWMLIPDLRVPFDSQNVNLSEQNMWEPRSETHSFDRFNEYLTRFVNKAVTWNPEGLDENGQLIGFSLEEAIRNPDSQTKTHAEIIQMMQQGGIWNDGTGFNKARTMENLRKPLV